MVAFYHYNVDPFPDMTGDLDMKYWRDSHELKSQKKDDDWPAPRLEPSILRKQTGEIMLILGPRLKVTIA